MPYPHIAGRQDMEEEPSDKLLCCERHGLLTVVIGIISPKERDSAVPEGKDAVIIDHRSMGIPAEILQDTHGAIERRFAIHDPLLMIELSPECLEGAGLFEMTDRAGEDKVICCEALFEEIEELASEQRRHDPYGEEEAFATRNPAAPVGRQSAPGDYAVDVGMIHEVLHPGVENADHSYPCTEMPRIAGEFPERFGYGTEKKIVQDLLVHGDEGIQCRGNGEDHMEVWDRQEILAARLDPRLFP